MIHNNSRAVELQLFEILKFTNTGCVTQDSKLEMSQAILKIVQMYAALEQAEMALKFAKLIPILKNKTQAYKNIVGMISRELQWSDFPGISNNPVLADYRYSIVVAPQSENSDYSASVYMIKKKRFFDFVSQPKAQSENFEEPGQDEIYIFLILMLEWIQKQYVIAHVESSVERYKAEALIDMKENSMIKQFNGLIIDPLLQDIKVASDQMKRLQGLYVSDREKISEEENSEHLVTLQKKINDLQSNLTAIRNSKHSCLDH